MKKIQKSIFKWEKKLKKFKSIPNRNVLDSIRMNNCKEILNDLKAIDKDINNDYLIMTSRQIAEEGWYINEKGSLGLHKHGQKTSAYLVYDLTFYNDRTYLYSKLNGTWRKATESEVKEAFTNYFRSQGWVSGKTKFRGALGAEHTYREPLKLSMFGHIYVESCGTLFNSDILALATKIEDENIMVDGKCAKNTFAISEMYNGKPTGDTEYFIEGVKVTKPEWMRQNRINDLPTLIKELQEEYTRLTNK